MLPAFVHYSRQTGRYPLIYQSIRLTLNYFKRISVADSNSFVRAAFEEQKNMKLPWYTKLKPLLKLDEIYSLDHVSAFRLAKADSSNKKQDVSKHSNAQQPNRKTTQIRLNSLPDHFKIFSNTCEAKPIKSKKFRVGKIVEKLHNHFKTNWEHQKSTSSKLSFYHSFKDKFERESYLDLVKGTSRRHSTTQLRISAHDYEIERGRYKNIPRDKRICSWCKTSMGIEAVEDESHALFSCDLYEKHRIKTIKNINQALTSSAQDLSQHESTPYNINLEVTTLNLESYLMPLLSPDTPETESISEISKSLHLNHESPKITDLPDPIISILKQRRSYVVNCVSTFIFRCSEERKKLTESTRLSNKRFLNLNINLVRNSAPINDP